MTSRLQLDRDAAGRLLDLLMQRLRAAGVDARVHVVGGVAVGRIVPDARLTRDIDSAVATTSRRQFDDAVAEIAVEERLPADWLNQSAAPWVPVAPQVQAGDGAQLTFATTDEVIAMKLAAGRAQDVQDLIRIVQVLGLRDAASLVDIAFEQYGDDNVTLTGRDDLMLFAQEIIDAADV